MRGEHRADVLRTQARLQYTGAVVHWRSAPRPWVSAGPRPQAWSLAAFGQPGVEAVIDFLNTELTNIMRQAGTPTIASITREFVTRAQRI